MHPTKAEAQEVKKRIFELAQSRGLEVVETLEGAKPDAVVSLGGDGTMLRAAGEAHRLGVPLLGVNAGRVGFLSSIESHQIEDALDEILAGRTKVEDRMMLRARAGDVELTALNEVAVERSTPGRVAHMRVAVDDETIVTYIADAFIVATPSGSTGYSLSAGGPVIEPGLPVMILTPVSAHYPLWKSSLVIGTHHVVHLEIVEGSAALSADGESNTTLNERDVVSVRLDPLPLKVLAPLSRSDDEGTTFFRKLKSRFGLDTDRGAGRPGG